jgi:hypothetical protein
MGGRRKMEDGRWKTEIGYQRSITDLKHPAPDL